MRSPPTTLGTGLLVIALAAGCSSDEKATTNSASPTPGNGSDSATTEQVDLADTFAVAAVTWDTETDQSETAALIRVADLATAELADTFVEPPAGSGAYFNEAYAKGAASYPTVVEESNPAQPPDTSTEVYRTYTATWQWAADDGSTWDDPRTRSLYLTIAKQPDDTWLVSTYDYEDHEEG